MFADWVEDLLARGYRVVRPVLIALLAAGDLALLHRPGGAADWALALAGLAVYAAGAARPVASTLGLAALLGVAEATSSAVLITVKALLAITLFELAVRRPAAYLLPGAGAFCLAVAAGWIGEPAAEILRSLFRVAVFLAVLLLAGAYIRSVRIVARQAGERAAEEVRRRGAETRAARAAERTAIARELHDLVAHHVSSMVLRVGVARHVLPDAEPRVAEVLDDLHSAGTAALADLGHLVSVLRDPAPDAPPPVEPAALPAALDRVVGRGRDVGLTVDASIDPGVAGLDAVRGVTVLRLTQEGLANVARHAGPAAAARLSVEVAGGAVRLRLADDGGGRRDAPGTSEGYGLVGMRERVELLGGRLDAGPDGNGWTLSAELPVGSGRAEPLEARP